MKIRILLFIALLLGVGNKCMAQSISTVTPGSAMPGQTIDITIRGINTHFQNGISKANFGPGITVQKFVVANTVTATATIFVSQNDTPRFTNVTVATRGETAELFNGFQVFRVPLSQPTADIVILPLESISLKNIDLTNPSATPELFYIDVYNNDTPRIVNLNVSVSSTSGGLLGTLSRKNMSLAPDAVVKFTNRDFNAIKTNGQAGTNFLTQVELTGAFPPDNYTYVLTITNVNGSIVTTATTSAVVTNPLTNPSLVTPGGPMTSAVPDVYNPLPLFQWFGQNDKYDFALYMYRQGQTAEDVVRNVPVYKQQGINGSSLLYPNSAEKLIEGQKYAWQVQGEIVATSAHNLLSDVFWFTYRDINSIGKQVVTSITLTPEEVTVPSGQQYQFKATFYDQNGAVMTDVTPVWSVTPNFGTITQTGLFTAGQGGNTVAVLVSAGAATEFATVAVSLNIQSNYYNPFEGFLKKLFGIK